MFVRVAALLGSQRAGETNYYIQQKPICTSTAHVSWEKWKTNSNLKPFLFSEYLNITHAITRECKCDHTLQPLCTNCHV